MTAISGIVMYSTRFCPFCVQARRLFENKGVAYSDIPVDANPTERSRMEELSGRYTVPQIWIGDRHVGGFDDLWRLEQRGELDPLLHSHTYLMTNNGE
jgi:glutaredoxin 3